MEIIVNMRKLILGIFTLASAQAVANQCDEPAKWAMATYAQVAYSDNPQQRHRTLTLWRKPNNVAHQYPQLEITQAWQSVRPDTVKPIRYFDAHERAIEYQPGELIHGKRDTNWSEHNQLISDTLLRSMRLTHQDGIGCDKVEHYVLNHRDGSIKVAWLAQKKLVKTMVIENNTRREEFTLQHIHHNKAAISAFFEHRDKYKSTDYADIGDDHTDPFLTNMVHQGFIEAGASGFYQANGEPLPTAHAH